jgi:hypothetical protein
VPRRWDRSELVVSPGTARESSRLSRSAARLLAATATATAITAFVATTTDAALVEPARQAAEAQPPASAGPPPPPGRDGDSARPGGGQVEATAGPEAAAPAALPGIDAPATAGDQPLQPQGTTVAVPPDLLPGPPAPTPAAGTVEHVTLVDDDEGLPLFRGPVLAPGGRVVRCITLTYAGSRDADIGMRVEGGGELAPWLRLRLTTGLPATRECAGFVPRRELAAGDLVSLSAGSGWTAARAASGESFTVRIEAELAREVPARLAGTSADGRFVWSVTP